MEIQLENIAQFPHPFGMGMPGRSWTTGSADGYRFGFNGQEQVDEVYGNGNLNAALFWEYDTRLGRRWNVDPVSHKDPAWSPYRAFYDNPIYWSDPNGLREDNYSVDDKGNVNLEEKTNDDFDILYTKSDWDAGNRENSLKVNNRNVLPDLAKSRSDFNGNYAVSDNKSQLFKVFDFAVNYTNVEWGITGHRMDGGNEYVLRTSHDKVGYGMGGVGSILSIERYKDEFSLIFDMHSHPTGGTQGASQTYGLYDDMDIIVQRYYDFKAAGMVNIDNWFRKDDKWTVFPKHYVYPKGSGKLYHYDPWNNSIFIRSVSKSSDLYIDLGF